MPNLPRLRSFIRSNRHTHTHTQPHKWSMYKLLITIQITMCQTLLGIQHVYVSKYIYVREYTYTDNIYGWNGEAHKIEPKKKIMFMENH